MPAEPTPDPAVRTARRDGVTLSLAISVVGVVFGVLARTTADLSVAKTCAMSLLVFTGASQFAAVSVVAGGGSAIAAVASALLLAARAHVEAHRPAEAQRRPQQQAP